MSEPPAERYFRALLEDMVGMPLPDDPAALAEAAEALGVDPANPSTWTELERRWHEMRPAVDELRPSGAADWPTPVEAVFQSTFDRLGADAFEPSALARESAGVRMLMSTRAIEGAVNDGGWPSVFYNEMDGHIDGAIEGYRLLGLAGHAALAERAKEHGFYPDRDDEAHWEALDNEWFALPEAELAREIYLEAHPDEFPGLRAPHGP